MLAGLAEPGPSAAREFARAQSLRGRVLRRYVDAVTRPIAIVGPTGTGKSELALKVAERLSGRIAVEVINADAMQQYRGMDIGTAKVPSASRHGVAHHQLDVLDVTETATVARYQKAAVADVESIAARGAVPVIVGGSMMYVQSLLDGWEFPATDPEVRGRWERRLAEVGTAAYTPNWLAATRSPPSRSWPPTAAESSGHWRSSN